MQINVVISYHICFTYGFCFFCLSRWTFSGFAFFLSHININSSLAGTSIFNWTFCSAEILRKSPSYYLYDQEVIILNSCDILLFNCTSTTLLSDKTWYLSVNRECYEHKRKHEPWWSAALYTGWVYVYFYTVKYMLVEVWSEPIGMSCGAPMETEDLMD